MTIARRVRFSTRSALCALLLGAVSTSTVLPPSVAIAQDVPVPDLTSVERDDFVAFRAWAGSVRAKGRGYGGQLGAANGLLTQVRANGLETAATAQWLEAEYQRTKSRWAAHTQRVIFAFMKRDMLKKMSAKIDDSKAELRVKLEQKGWLKQKAPPKTDAEVKSRTGDLQKAIEDTFPWLLSGALGAVGPEVVNRLSGVILSYGFAYFFDMGVDSLAEFIETSLKDAGIEIYIPTSVEAEVVAEVEKLAQELGGSMRAYYDNETIETSWGQNSTFAVDLLTFAGRYGNTVFPNFKFDVVKDAVGEIVSFVDLNDWRVALFFESLKIYKTTFDDLSRVCAARAQEVVNAREHEFLFGEREDPRSLTERLCATYVGDSWFGFGDDGRRILSEEATTGAYYRVSQEFFDWLNDNETLFDTTAAAMERLAREYRDYPVQDAAYINIAQIDELLAFFELNGATGIALPEVVAATWPGHEFNLAQRIERQRAAYEALRATKSIIEQKREEQRRITAQKAKEELIAFLRDVDDNVDTVAVRLTRVPSVSLPDAVALDPLAGQILGHPYFAQTVPVRLSGSLMTDAAQLAIIDRGMRKAEVVAFQPVISILHRDFDEASQTWRAPTSCGNRSISTGLSPVTPNYASPMTHEIILNNLSVSNGAQYDSATGQITVSQPGAFTLSHNGPIELHGAHADAGTVSTLVRWDIQPEFEFLNTTTLPCKYSQIEPTFVTPPPVSSVAYETKFIDYEIERNGAMVAADDVTFFGDRPNGFYQFPQIVAQVAVQGDGDPQTFEVTPVQGPLDIGKWRAEIPFASELPASLEREMIINAPKLLFSSLEMDPDATNGHVRGTRRSEEGIGYVVQKERPLTAKFDAMFLGEATLDDLELLVDAPSELSIDDIELEASQSPGLFTLTGRIAMTTRYNGMSEATVTLVERETGIALDRKKISLITEPLRVAAIDVLSVPSGAQAPGITDLVVAAQPSYPIASPEKVQKGVEFRIIVEDEDGGVHAVSSSYVDDLAPGASQLTNTRQGASVRATSSTVQTVDDRVLLRFPMEDLARILAPVAPIHEELEVRHPGIVEVRASYFQVERDVETDVVRFKLVGPVAARAYRIRMPDGTEREMQYQGEQRIIELPRREVPLGKVSLLSPAGVDVAAFNMTSLAVRDLPRPRIRLDETPLASPGAIVPLMARVSGLSPLTEAANYRCVWNSADDRVTLDQETTDLVAITSRDYRCYTTAQIGFGFSERTPAPINVRVVER